MATGSVPFAAERTESGDAGYEVRIARLRFECLPKRRARSLVLTELQLRGCLPERPTRWWLAVAETLCVAHAFQSFLITAELEENTPPGCMREDVTRIELDRALELAQRCR